MVILSMMLSSCSPKKEPTATPKPAAATEAPAQPTEKPKEEPAEKIELTLEMSIYVEAPHKKAFDMLEDRYEELNPNVDIVLYGAPYAEFWDKLTTEIVAGTEVCIV